MSQSLNQNACMHTLRRDIPSINVELHRSSFSVHSSAHFFWVLGKFLVLLIPVFSIWCLEIISCYLKGRTTLLTSQGQKSEWELRASSICNNPEALNSISSPAFPVHSPELISRKIDHMSTEDWQLICCSALMDLSIKDGKIFNGSLIKCFNGFFPPTKAMPVNNIYFSLLAQKHKYRYEGLDSKLEF